MPPDIPDRYLWLGLGLTLFIAAPLISLALSHIQTLTTIHNPPPVVPHPYPRPSQSSHTSPESAIKTSSLQILATESPNVEIRKAATRILCRRFIEHEGAYKQWRRDLGSKDEEVRKRAETAARLLGKEGFLERETGGRRRVTNSGVGIGSARGRGATENRDGDLDVEERDLRRRRREAVVVNEGNEPIGRNNVWMRDGEGMLETGG